jgi:hypothetical protein
LAPGFSANRGTAPGRGRSLIAPQLCMLTTSLAGMRACATFSDCSARAGQSSLSQWRAVEPRSANWRSPLSAPLV